MKEKGYDGLQDHELIQLFVQKREKEIFEVLYLRYKNMIYSYIRKFLYKTPEDIALDILNEVFIQVYMKLPTLKNPKAFKIWLYRIARSFCLQHIRMQKNDYNLSLDSYNLTDEINIKDLRINIEEQYINAEIRHFILKEITKLDHYKRELILYKFYDDLTYEEISEILDKPVSTIKSQIKKIMELIYKELEKEGYL